jgi:hypothetical protein
VRQRDAAPWLTAADRAEWELLWRVLVDEVFAHREAGCERCDAGDCPSARGAIEAAVEWAELRSAHSFAIAMRRRQDIADLMTEATASAANGKEAA